MRYRALITYTWDKDRGETKWLFWLQKKLEAQGFEVSMSPLAKTIRKSEEVVSDIQAIYSIPDDSVFFVEHDPGCLTILKYLEFLSSSKRKDTALLIAGTPQRAAHIPVNHYLRLEATGEVVVYNAHNEKIPISNFTPAVRTQKLGEHLDIKLAVLYSADDEMLDGGVKLKLQAAPPSPQPKTLGDYFSGLWKKR